MHRKFAVFDIDGTIFRWQLYHELVFDLVDHGILPATIRTQIAPLLSDWHNRTAKSAYIDYELELVRIFAGHLKGLSVVDFKAGAQRVIKRSGDKVYTYTRDLLASLKEQDYTLIALSGSFIQIVEPFAKKYQFDHWVGAQCKIEHGQFTGEVEWSYDKKGENLAQLVSKYDLSFEDSIAIGDTPSDIPILEQVACPIAFNPNEELFKHASKQGWQIVVERKNVIYQLKPDAFGYRLISFNHDAAGG